MATKKTAAKSTKAAKKVVARKTTVKKNNPTFERAVRTATWGTIGFCALFAVWSILANGFSWTSFAIVAAMAVGGFLLRAAHVSNNQRLVDGLSALEAILVLVLHCVSVIIPKVIPIAGTVGQEFVSTGIIIADFLLLALLIVFLVMHFVCGTKSAKMAVNVNNRINFYILLVSVAAMVLWAANFGTTQAVAMVTSICYYGLVIFVTDLVQRLEEGK